MQNSAVMAIRATVLVVCLIAVPVIAISGKDAPEFVKSLIRDYTGTPANAASAKPGSADAPVFRPGLLAATTESPLPATAAAPAPLPSSELVAVPELSGNGTTSPRPISSAFSDPQAKRQTPAAIPAVTTVAHQVDSPTATQTAADRQAPAGPGDGDFNGGRFTRDYFRAAEARLRALGATYYLLETLGSAGEQYRFVCKVAAAGQGGQPLAFFAVDRDPLAAMNDVVRQVETWRSHLSQ